MQSDNTIDLIFQAKMDGISDEKIMQEYSVGLKDIEQAIIKRTGLNLNLFKGTTKTSSLFPRDFRPETTSVWSFKSRGKWATHSGEYRGNWSPYIPRNVILRYSKPGNLILDQFCGGGTTAVEAKLLGRRCIALDISPAAVELTKNNLTFDIEIQEALDDLKSNYAIYQPVVDIGDAQDLNGISDGSIDLICTHPPYANIVKYSDGIDGDLSLHNVEEFIGDMYNVARECFRVLKPGGFCAILIGDTRKKKRVVPIGFRTIHEFLEKGFLLKDLVIKRQHNCRTTGFWYSRSVKYNFLLLAQEYLPIFQKPIGTPQVAHSDETQNHFRINLLKPKPVSQLETIESMTTWVFPTCQVDTLVDANILHRYGGRNIIIEMKPDTYAKEQNMTSVEDLNLIYVKAKCEVSNLGRAQVEAFSSAVSNLTSKLVTGGHLVIRTQDKRIGEFTRSPVLKLWKSVREPLFIREIIVVSKEGDALDYSSELATTHEYVLVYQKD